MIWATVGSQSCFCWLYRASSSLAAKNIISLILVLTIWWYPCVESSLVVGRWLWFFHLSCIDVRVGLWRKLSPKRWYFWTVVLEKTLESPLDCKEIQPVHPKGDQPWVFIGRTEADAETPVLWPPHAKSWLIGKDPDVGRDWEQEEKEMTEDEMAGWHHQLDGHEFE